MNGGDWQGQPGTGQQWGGPQEPPPQGQPPGQQQSWPPPQGQPPYNQPAYGQPAPGQQWNGPYQGPPPNYQSHSHRSPGYEAYLTALAANVAPQQESDDQVRGNLITKIWGCAIGMLGVCIPLVAVAHDSSAMILPFTVIVGASASTVVIWNPFRRKSAPLMKAASDDAQIKKIQELEERLASIETITNFEEKLLDSRLRKMGADAVPIENPRTNSRPATTPAETTFGQGPISQ